MDDIVLYTYGDQFDPVSLIAKSWHALYDLDNFKSVESDYY